MAGFAVGPSVTNKPSDIADAFVVYVEMGYQAGKATQRLIDWNGTVYSRFQHSGGWYDWRRLDNFGCNTLEALATALGGFDIQKTSTTIIPDFKRMPQAFCIGADTSGEYMSYAAIARIWCGYYGMEICTNASVCKIRRYFIDAQGQVEKSSWISQ